MRHKHRQCEIKSFGSLGNHMHKPRISVIIPTYNTQEYIARCLDSCLHQSLKEIEFLIIDDCGQDDSIAIAKEYAQRDPRFKILHNPQNLGTFHARAHGIANAQGEFCMFADPDDFLHEKACERALMAITAHQSDMVHFGVCYHPRDFRRIRPLIHKGRLDGENMRKFLSAGNNTQGLWDKIYRTQVLRQALKKLDFIVPPLCMLEDGLLVLVASLESTSYVGLDECLYYYCFNPNSITKSTSLENFRKKQIQFDKMLDSTTKLFALYPAHTTLLQAYQRKVASTFLAETRHFGALELYSTMQILAQHGFEKNIDLPPYLKSILLCLRYAFRWQNLVRVFAFILSLGKLRL